MELMEQDLDQMLKACSTPFKESNLIRIAYNALCSIAFLHEANIMHRDMKCSNLLLNSDGNVKIGDFGLSRTMPQSYSDLKGHNTIATREEFFKKCQAKLN